MNEKIVKSKYDLQDVIDAIITTHNVYVYYKNSYSFYVEPHFFERIGFTNLYEILENAIELRCRMLDEVRTYTIAQRKLINSEDIIIQATDENGKEVFILTAYILTEEVFNDITALDFRTFIAALQNNIEYQGKKSLILEECSPAEAIYYLMLNFTNFIQNFYQTEKTIKITDILFRDKYSIEMLVFYKSYNKHYLFIIEVIGYRCCNLGIYETKKDDDGKLQKDVMIYFKEIRMTDKKEKENQQ